MKYVNLRIPLEFKDWLNKRQVAIINNHAFTLSRRHKKLKLTNVMRILSKVDIFCPPEKMQKLLKRELKIKL